MIGKLGNMGEKEENEIDQKGVAVDKRVICLCYFLFSTCRLTSHGPSGTRNGVH